MRPKGTYITKIKKMTIVEAQKIFNEKLQEIISGRNKPTIMVCGYTGVGKTSLIQAILGKEVVPDEAIAHGTPGTINFFEYQDEFITLVDTRGFEPAMNEDEYLKTAKAEVQRRQKSNNVKDHIHLVWYCISAGVARITSTDIKFIKDVFPFQHVQVIITKSDFLEHRPQQKEAFLKILAENGIPDEKITFVSDVDTKGQPELVNKSLQVIPEAYRDAFISKQKIDFYSKKKKAKKIIAKKVTKATAIGLIPLADIPLLVPLQFEMMALLAENYGFQKQEIKSLFGPTVMATIVTSLTATTAMDSIPVIGWVGGALAVRTITAGIGHLANNYLCECYKAIIEGYDVKSVKPFRLTKKDLEKAIKAHQAS